MTLKDYLKIIYDEEISQVNNYWFYPRIYCNDGFNISIQGGVGLYSKPNTKSVTYETMEIGFPSENDLLINVDEEVKGFVPVSKIQNMIERHEGINIKMTLTNYINTKSYKLFMINTRLNKLKNLI